MQKKILLQIVFICFSLTHGIPCGAQEPLKNKNGDDVVLTDAMAFVQLTSFVDRGVMCSNFDISPKKSDIAIEELNNKEIVDNVSVYFQTRDRNLTLSDFNSSWFQIKSEPSETLGVTLERLNRLGLIVLFCHENCRLLDKPLSTRTGLMTKLNAIASEVAAIQASLYFTKGVTKSDKVFAVAQMRRHSVDFDFAILENLSSAEKARVARLVTYILPAAMNQSVENQKELTLGSRILAGIMTPRVGID